MNENTKVPKEIKNLYKTLHNLFPYFRHTIQISKAVVITVIVILIPERTGGARNLRV